MRSIKSVMSLWLAVAALASVSCQKDKKDKEEADPTPAVEESSDQSDGADQSTDASQNDQTSQSSPIDEGFHKTCFETLNDIYTQGYGGILPLIAKGKSLEELYLEFKESGSNSFQGFIDRQLGIEDANSGDDTEEDTSGSQTNHGFQNILTSLASSGASTVFGLIVDPLWNNLKAYDCKDAFSPQNVNSTGLLGLFFSLR